MAPPGFPGKSYTFSRGNQRFTRDRAPGRKMEKRAMFRWHMSHDLDLAKEVVAVRPQPCLSDWDTIAANLESAWPEDKNRNLQGRSCKEHFERMIAHHKDSNKAALKKSGTEEQYTELMKLMDDATAFVADMDRLNKEKSAKTATKKQREDQDKKMGFMLRDAAMETLKRKPSEDASDSDSESPGSSKKKARTRTGKRPDVMSFLETKNEVLSEFREKELKYKKNQLEMEAQLKREQMEIEKRKIAIQERQMELQLQMMNALISRKDN